MKVWLHRASAQPRWSEVLEVCAVGEENSTIRVAMHLDAQDELGSTENLDAVLAFEAVLDPLDLVDARQVKEGPVNAEDR